jgi:hypothetical protein
VKDFLLTKDMDSILKDWSEGFQPPPSTGEDNADQIEKRANDTSSLWSRGPGVAASQRIFPKHEGYELRHKRSPELLMDEMGKTYSILFATFAPDKDILQNDVDSTLVITYKQR